VPYRPLGADHFDILDQEREKRRALRQLDRFGYEVTTVEKAA